MLGWPFWDSKLVGPTGPDGPHGEADLWTFVVSQSRCQSADVEDDEMLSPSDVEPRSVHHSRLIALGTSHWGIGPGFSDSVRMWG